MNASVPDPTAKIEAHEFAAALDGVPASGPVAVAYSGGPDSLCLLHLARLWAQARDRPLVALTVDHGLRDGSRAEAEAAGRMAQSLGVPHHILAWDAPEKGAADLHANTQAQAREARYRLLADACRQAGAATLLLAHHQDDQAETFLLRLARGSGVDGLAAMAARREWQGLILARPLLGFARARLCATLESEGLTGLEDPSNDNPRFDRVKMRQAMADLGALGLTPPRLAETARRMARARSALEAETLRFLAAHATLDAVGYAVIERSALLDAAPEIALRALSAVLKTVSGAYYRPREEGLLTLYENVIATAETDTSTAQAAPAAARTLAGCLVRPRLRSLLIMREPMAALQATPVVPPATARLTPKPPAQQETVSQPPVELWDDRYLVDVSVLSASQKVAALGEEGVARLRAAGALPTGHPIAALQSAPALWSNGFSPHLLVTETGLKAPLTAAPRAWRL